MGVHFSGRTGKKQSRIFAAFLSFVPRLFCFFLHSNQHCAVCHTKVFFSFCYLFGQLTVLSKVTLVAVFCILLDIYGSSSGSLQILPEGVNCGSPLKTRNHSRSVARMAPSPLRWTPL